MALIKSHNTEQHAGQAVVLDLGDLRQQANAILAKAREQAAHVLEQAKTQAEAIHVEAKQAGYDTGYEIGKNEGHAEGVKQGQEQAHAEAKTVCDQIQQAWIHAAEQWDAMRNDMISEAQQSLLKFAVLTAEKIVHRVQITDPVLIQSQVNAAIEYVVSPCAVKIHICPDDREQLEALLPQMLSQLAAAEHVELVDDVSIQRGGCVVEYGKGRIDARIESQLEQMIEMLIPGSSSVEVDQSATFVSEGQAETESTTSNLSETQEDSSVDLTEEQE